jgi:hypothetical protein
VVKRVVKWELSLKELQELLRKILRKNAPTLFDWSKWRRKAYFFAQKLGTYLDNPVSPTQENRQEVQELKELLTDISEKCEVLNIRLEEELKD